MTKPSNIEGIESATKMSWAEWVQLLDEKGARDLTHPQIAALVHNHLEEKIDSAGWWSQGVTVAYEQEIGRRKPGQTSDGFFEFSVSRTFQTSKEALFDQLTERMNRLETANGVLLDNTRTSVTPVRSYWKSDLADGTKLVCAVESRSDSSAAIVITHSHIEGSDTRDSWHDFWKRFISEI